MSKPNTPKTTKILIYMYALLTGTSVLFSSTQANNLDEVLVASLTDASSCTQCIPCPIHEDIRDCGEKFVRNPLVRNDTPTLFFQDQNNKAIEQNQSPLIIYNGKTFALR